MAKSALTKIKDILPGLNKRFKSFGGSEVLVGVPADKTNRDDEMTNAGLAYIHDNGSPAANIPARPFMRPGIAAAKSDIIRKMKQGAKKVLKGNSDDTLTMVGLIAQSAIRAKINEGIPPPLADSTLKGRIRQRQAIKGAKAELAHRKAGGAAGLGLAKPLIQTGQLRNSISFVIRKRK